MRAVWSGESTGYRRSNAYLQQAQPQLWRRGCAHFSNEQLERRYVRRYYAQEEQLAAVATQAEVVLSDWLIESGVPANAVSAQAPQTARYWSSQQYLGLLSGSFPETASDSSSDSSSSSTSTSAPHKFQKLVSAMWSELAKDDALYYLGDEGQARVKRSLVVLAAYAALKEHPSLAVDSPKAVFAEMDFDSDGEVTFDEFVRWYESSAAAVDHKGSDTDSSAVSATVQEAAAATVDTEAVVADAPDTAAETVAHTVKYTDSADVAAAGVAATATEITAEATTAGDAANT
eukprot:17725-Heterococcus_DN1.PRE.1